MCLENGLGDCARDKDGRPIILSIGMTHGSFADMQNQMVLI